MSLLKNNFKLEQKNTSNFSLPFSSMGVLTNLLFVKINDKVAIELEKFKEELKADYQRKKSELKAEIKSELQVELREELKREIINCVQDGIRREVLEEARLEAGEIETNGIGLDSRENFNSSLNSSLNSSPHSTKKDQDTHSHAGSDEWVCSF